MIRILIIPKIDVCYVNTHEFDLFPKPLFYRYLLEEKRVGVVFYLYG